MPGCFYSMLMDEVLPIVKGNENLKNELHLASEGKACEKPEFGNLKKKGKRSLFSNNNKIIFDTAVLEHELIKFKDICKVDEDELPKIGNLWKHFNNTMFTEFANSVHENCPMLTSIIETISIGDWTKYNTGRKSSSYKFKSTIQMVLALDDIKSQRTSSNFSTLFGLLLITYGLGNPCYVHWNHLGSAIAIISGKLFFYWSLINRIDQF